MHVCMCTHVCVHERASLHCASHRYKNVLTNPIELPTARFLVYSPCVCEAKDLSIRTEVVASFVRHEKGIRNVCVLYIFTIYVTEAYGNAKAGSLLTRVKCMPASNMIKGKS